MKHLKLYEKSDEGLDYDEFTDILADTPVFHAVFVMIDDFHTEEDHLIAKGTELFCEDSNLIELTTICPEEIYSVEIPQELIKFVEYRNKKNIDDELNMFRQSNKYNI